MIENKVFGVVGDVYVDVEVEPSDTIETIAQYTHFTAKELCDLLSKIIKKDNEDRLELATEIIIKYEDKSKE